MHRLAGRSDGRKISIGVVSVVDGESVRQRGGQEKAIRVGGEAALGLQRVGDIATRPSAP
jgi:hypothetical protein